MTAHVRRERSAARETRTLLGWITSNGDAPKSAADGTAADTFTFMSEINFDRRTQPVLRMLLTAAIVISAVALAVAIVTAVLVDMQSDYLGAQSEQGGLFDPSVFPTGAVANRKYVPHPVGNIAWHADRGSHRRRNRA